MNRGLAARGDPAIEGRIIDLAHKDVVADPMGAVQRIYGKFSLTFSDVHKARIARFLTENPAAKRMGKHKHSPEEYGIDNAEVRTRMADYYDRFGDLLGRPA
jgi:hypothetical protein